jgi:hypothetical protein
MPSFGCGVCASCRRDKVRSGTTVLHAPSPTLRTLDGRLCKGAVSIGTPCIATTVRPGRLSIPSHDHSDNIWCPTVGFVVGEPGRLRSTWVSGTDDQRLSYMRGKLNMRRRNEYLLTLPQLTCLLITVPASGCSLSDVSCQCSNAELSRASAACLLANCTMAETLGTLPFEYS